MKRYKALKNFDAGFGQILTGDILGHDRIESAGVASHVPVLLKEGLVVEHDEVKPVEHKEHPELKARIEDPSRRKGKKVGA